MENRQGYDPSEFEDDDYMNPQPDAGKSIRGYRIVIIILSVILVAISVLYFSIHRQQMLDNELLQADRDSIQNDLGRLMTDYDELQISNDSISAGLNFRTRTRRLADDAPQEGAFVEPRQDQTVREGGRHAALHHEGLREADRLAQHAQQTAHQGERRIPQGDIVGQTARRHGRGEAAELDNKVKVGSVLRARDIRLAALNDPEQTRIEGSRAPRACAWTSVLAANELATPGNKAVYVRITSPDGYVLTTEAMPTFEFEGERLSYSAMREIDYRESGPRSGHLLQLDRIRGRNLPDPALQRRPSDRPDAGGGEIAPQRQTLKGGFPRKASLYRPPDQRMPHFLNIFSSSGWRFCAQRQ